MACRSCVKEIDLENGIRLSMIGSNLDQPGVSSAPDEVLMKAVSHRRYDALAELYDRHGQRLRATIDGVVHEEADADDVLQEIFIQIWKEAGRYSPKAGKPLGWMVTIARRRAIDRASPRANEPVTAIHRDGERRAPRTGTRRLRIS